MVLDYKGIEALHAVLELNSFEGAAKKLHITQSAVSQRIKGLENFYGEPVMIRTQPYSPSRLGEYLIGHFKQICLLEDTLEQEMGSELTKPRVSIALNRDSLETWFLDILEENDIARDITLEIIADDQELTLEYLKKGLVSACLSTSQKEIVGGNVTFLGYMEYVLVASPEYKKKYFSKKSPKKCLLEASALKFDQNDKLHERYIEKYFHMDGREISYQIVPSVRGFKKYALLGYGYGLIPTIDIVEELKKKRLINLFKEKTWKVPLYWHHWAIESKFYQAFNKNIIRYAKKKLKPFQQ